MEYIVVVMGILLQRVSQHFDQFRENVIKMLKVCCKVSSIVELLSLDMFVDI